MAIDAMRSSLTSALRNNRITRDEIRDLVRNANSSGATIDATERAELQNILSTHGSKFTTAARSEFSRLLGAPTTGPVVTPPTGTVNATPVMSPIVAALNSASKFR